MGTILSLFWIKSKITFKFISPLILRGQRHTRCNFIFLLSSMWRNWLKRTCIHRHRDRYSSINLSLIFQIRTKVQIFIPKTRSTLPAPTRLAPVHPADTSFFLLASCWPFHDHKLTWADFAWATFPLAPFLGLWRCVGQGLIHRMEDQPGVGRDTFGTGDKKELTECSLPCLREKVSSGRRCCRAGLILWSGEVRLEGKRRKCNFHKGYGGIMPCYCLWQRCDLVLLQIRDDGAWGWVRAGGRGFGFGCFGRLLWAGVWKPGHCAVPLYSEDVIC